ncbi:hypothetical protein H310_05150 [Aphanomyces invadans]|uniref:DDE Tnp4 domain-containing protein n=1 Tax=Aphanomyces invadans TaxID=157072 RepID=A0A024UBX9_9STRA|nr:hypothetical protein H310_05150 [Aphanomyces invadans]ETW03784.1 hypothetical protein H310_05150 [Aphanomyces invadans]|eukprot:XP_008868013.1 hypothetical protein H310_05150 [Aphanomyces invadans]
MVLNITSMLERLHMQSVSDQLFLEESLGDYGDAVDEENDTVTYSNPVIDNVIEESGAEGFRTLTNFNPMEFEIVWSVVETELQARWNDSRGRKSKTTPKNALFITLVIMKYYQTWEKHALDFDNKAPTLEKIVLRVVEVVSPLIYNYFVVMPTMEQIHVSGHPFANYPYAKYATDVKFQPSHRPAGGFGEQKHYFSGKHKLYGLKIEASFSPQGKLVDMSNHEPGSVSDLTTFRKRHDTHVANLTKTPSEATINDNGELHQTSPNVWAVLVGKNYVGLTESVRAVHPKKRPIHGALDCLDPGRNAAVSADRAIVENFSAGTFVWGTKIFDGIQRLNFALTNFHVGLMPLREDDRHHYRSVLARYARMAEEKIT